MQVDTKIYRDLIHKIRNLEHSKFDALAMDVFQYQARHNPIYKRYLSYLNRQPSQVHQISEIPFLPIQFFKNQRIQTGDWEAEAVFGSSGTTGNIRSLHQIRSLDFYRTIAASGFEQLYGPLNDFCVLALLPSYLERQDSSLVDMVQYFSTRSGHPDNAFHLNDLEGLQQKLLACQAKQIPCLLIGVSFALLDLAESYPMNLSNIIIMETGGMKGRRKEITRSELHVILKKAFQAEVIHSEYGMTELLSQGYSKGNGLFECIPTMKVLTRELSDPLSPQKIGKNGGLNIVDLANIDSCSFIATEDIGKVYADGTFEVLGRIDHSAVRGCNLMVADIDFKM